MRYGPIAEDPLEEQLLASRRAPLGLFATFLPLVQARALMAGVSSGVFEGLRGGERDAAELASDLAVDGDTLLLLLRVLARSGYLEESAHGTYGLSDVARTTLVGDSPDRVTAWVGMMEMFWSRLADMGEVLRTGHGVDMHGDLGDASDWAVYQAAMLENARRMAPLVAATVPVKAGATTLLDIAGSHGLFGALIARAHPPMRSLVLDLPPAVEAASKLAAAEGIDDVVSYRSGDALADDLGAGYDVVFLGNILHHFIPSQITGLLERIRRALSPGGTVAVWDGAQPGPGDPPDLAGDAFSLFFRLTSTARCYTATEHTGWLAGAGFVDVQLHPLPVGRFFLLATGRTPE